MTDLRNGYCKHCGEVLANHVDLKCPYDATTYEFGSGIWEDIRPIILQDSIKEIQEAEDRAILKLLLEIAE